MRVNLYTAKNKLLDEVLSDSVHLPTLSGEITVLDNHNPIIGILREGEVSVHDKNNKVISLEIDKGYFEFSENNLNIFIEKTKLSFEELKVLEEKAIKARKKDVSISSEESISEKEFTERKESEGF